MNNETEMMDNVEVKTKRCCKCGRFLPLSSFSHDKSRKDGLQCWCKDCQKAMRKKYHITHRDSELKKQADYYQTHKGKIKAYKAEWRAKNPTYYADYYQTHKEEKKAYNAEYQANYTDPQKNPLGFARHMVAHYRQMDRQRGFDDSQTISAEWFLENIAYCPCAHCGVQGIGKVGCNRLDNRKPHTIDNVEPCCPSCNFSQNILDQIRRGVHVSCKGKARHKTA